MLAIPLCIVALLSIGAAVYLVRRDTLSNDAAAPQPSASFKSALEQALEKEPCDRVKMYDFAKELLEARESRRSIERVNAFLARCGDDPRVRLQLYFAHGNLSEWDAAAAVMTKLIADDPQDSRYWSWRGMAYERKGNLRKAAADFRQALLIKPSIKGIPFNLARVYERMKTPCEGIGALEQFIHHNPKEHVDTTRAQLAHLYSLESCASVVGNGNAVIRFSPGSNVISAMASIEGHSGKFLVDTGASYVGLTASFVKATGIATDPWPTMLVATAAGVKKTKVGTVSSVELQGVKAGRIEAAVIDDMPGIQGLLGQSFLTRFVLNVDPAKGVLELKARRTAEGGGGKK